VDFKIDWTLRSRDDLRNIATYISCDNPEAALKLGDTIFKRVDALQQFPEMGRVVPERGQPEIREIVVGNYRIVYRLLRKRKVVEILRIWHGARASL
jgi:plasmid stabilization system protein ParE